MNQIQRVLLKSLRPAKVLSTNERFYGRWMHRNPAKVILPFEGSSLKKEKVIDLDSTVLKKSKEAHAINLKKGDIGNTNNQSESEIKLETPKISPEKSKEIKNNREIQLQKAKVNIKKRKVFDENDEVIYEKLKDNDGRISSLLVKLKSKKDRAKFGQVLVEGWRLIVDGLEAKCTLTHIIFSRLEDLNRIKPYLPKTGVLVYKIPYKEIDLWSDVETSPGILGVFQSPTPDNIRRFGKSLPLNIICDNIRVPGNLGAILRAAVGVGCKNIYLMKGCVDLWDSKVVRAAAGAHFRLPIHHAVDWENLPNLIHSDTSVFIADNNAKTQEKDDANEESRIANIPVLPYYSVDFGSLRSITLIIGGETEGISDDSYIFAADRNGLRLNIPLQKGVDSLNSGMAAAVIAFEIKKQLVQAKAQLSLTEDAQVISQ